MNLSELLAKASPARSGDELAGLAAANAEERVRAQMKLAELPLKAFLADPVIPYETDEVTGSSATRTTPRRSPPFRI